MFHTEDVNCILTDWRGGSSGLYTEAVNNVRIVGAELVYLVNLLEKDYGYSPANIHFIGHSLGAHAAGEAGRRKPGIGRITGLDPAGPLFQYTPTMVRLDPSDAKFVDIIHTHAGHLFFDFGWRKEIQVRVSATETMKGNIDVALTGTNGIRKKYTIDRMNMLELDNINIKKVFYSWLCHSETKGLDPAGPYFEGTPPEVRLDPTDANFVDVIHSNAAHFPAIGLGISNTTGHLDFYPNGGTVMPGCNDLIPEMKQSDFEVIIADATIIGGCHHSRSHEFYFESILYPTGYLGYPCETYKSFESGDCFPCSQEECPMMGHYADRFPAKLKRVNQKYFLNTAADPPFATWRQKVFIKLSGVKKMRGDINLIFHDTEGNTKEYEIARCLEFGYLHYSAQQKEISATDAPTIEYSNFNTSRITRFIVHGFIDNGEENWLSDMCKEEYGYSPADVHIIGHSLGAHVAGEAGRRQPGIGRITGLDPAQPYFQGTPVGVRLDKSDAEFVDVIHTDSAPTIPYLGFGMSTAIGHLDFYPNGGEQMPGCGKNPVSQIVDIDGIWEVWRYKVTVTLSGNSKVKGYVNLALYGSGGNTRQHQIFKGTLQPDNIYTSFIDAEVNIGTVTKVKFLWNNNWLNPTFPKLGAATITVQSGENGKDNKGFEGLANSQTQSSPEVSRNLSIEFNEIRNSP
ncbi:pancreatic lipase-related protein 2 [Grus japonensis]|uniref:Triacylglycerol lipase n=1 Tax=Grus japonensis TaxID=30415 RepID=A0ABC9X3L5_GRUJA